MVSGWDHEKWEEDPSQAGNLVRRFVFGRQFVSAAGHMQSNPMVLTQCDSRDTLSIASVRRHPWLNFLSSFAVHRADSSG